MKNINYDRYESEKILVIGDDCGNGPGFIFFDDKESFDEFLEEFNDDAEEYSEGIWGVEEHIVVDVELASVKEAMDAVITF